MESKLLSTVKDGEQRLGGDIRSLRQRRQLTQSELAELANVSQSAIKYLEAGKGSSLSTLILVARALDRSDWLAAFLPPQPSVSPMAALREQRRGHERTPKRVRRSVRAKPA